MFLEKFPYRVKFYTKDEPPEKQAPGMGTGDRGLGIGEWGLGNGERGSRKVLPPEGERGQPIIPIAPPEPL